MVLPGVWSVSWHGALLCPLATRIHCSRRSAARGRSSQLTPTGICLRLSVFRRPFTEPGEARSCALGTGSLGAEQPAWSHWGQLHG